MWEAAPEVFRIKTDDFTIDSDEAKRLHEQFEKLMKSNGVGVLTTVADAEPQIKTVTNNISTTNISDGDTIIITYDMNECDIDEINQIHKMYCEAFPNNNIVSQIFPIVKSIEVLHRVEKEDYPF